MKSNTSQTIPEHKLAKLPCHSPLLMPDERIAMEHHYAYKLWNTGVMEIQCYCGTQTAVTIPDTIAGHSVTWLGEEAFRKNRSLTQVVIPNSVTAIGFRTFEGCENLKLLFIPGSVESMWANAFHGCPNLTVLTEPGSYAESFCRKEGIPFQLIQ